MSKRSSKTSHVLDLITRRTAPSDDYAYGETAFEKSDPPDAAPVSGPYTDTDHASGPDQPAFMEASDAGDTGSARPDDTDLSFPDYDLSVSEMMLENEISGGQPAAGPSAEKIQQSLPVQPEADPPALSSHSLQWNEAEDDEPRMIDLSKEESPVRNSRLKNMIDDTADSDESVSLKLKKSLEAYLMEEYPTEDPEGIRRDSSHIYLEGEDQTMEKYENNRLNRYGNEFTHDRMDSVDSDISGASFAEENRDASESPNDLTPGKYMFVNVAEEIVRSKVPPIMLDYDMCTCERCTNDVVALTLNRIPPKYVVTMKGKLYARINACLPQYQTDMLAAITDSCTTVKNNSRHNSRKGGNPAR